MIHARLNDLAFDFSGRNVVVTGAAAGIGRAVARAFLQAGAAVLAVDRDGERLEAAFDEKAKKGERLRLLTGDVTDWSFADQIIAAGEMENGPVDTLVNCAGVFPSAPLGDITAAFWNSVHDINLKSVMRLSQAAQRSMRESERGGSIVNIASTNALRPKANHGAYASSKAGVVALSQALALELAPHIRVNCIAPGPVRTEGATIAAEKVARLKARSPGDVERQYASTIPLQRFGLPEEIAAAALYLSSSAGAYFNGAVLVIDGGATLR